MEDSTGMTEEVVDLGRDTRGGNDINKTRSDKKSLNYQDVKGKPIENYDEFVESDTLNAMQFLAKKLVAATLRKRNIVIDVTGINELKTGSETVKWFAILDSSDADNDYTIYQIGSNVYFRPSSEFIQIQKDIIDEVPGAGAERLKNEYQDVDEPLDSVSISRRDDCLFIVCSVFSSITGLTYKVSGNQTTVSESCKIRKHNKLGTDGLIKNSVAADEAKYGTPDENAFKQEVEDKQKKDGTVGALDQQPQESVKPVLPNVHRLTEAEELKTLGQAEEDGDVEIIWEPGDKVLVGKNADKGRVTGVIDDNELGQVVTVMVYGETINVEPKDLKPDLTDVMRQNRFNQVLYPDTYVELLGVNPETRLTDKVENDKTDYTKNHADMNESFIPCNIVVDGHRMNYSSMKASLKDISESKKVLRVINEEAGDMVQEWPYDTVSVDTEDWPWAVVVDSDNPDEENQDEPLRKVKINPTSYIEAGDEDFVEIILGDKQTKMLKKNIKIIS